MTKFAKLDAPTVSFDRPQPALPAASAASAGEPTASPRIDNALVTELESALQAGLTHAPRPQEAAAAATGPAEPEIAAPAMAVAEKAQPQVLFDCDLALEEVRQDSAGEAGEPAPPPYLLRPAASQPVPALGLEAMSTPRQRPAAGEPRRRRLPLRAALCVAGVVGLAGAGGAALILAAPDAATTVPPPQAASEPPEPVLAEPFEPPLARQVRTETIRVPAADMAPLAAGRQAESEPPVAPGAPARAAAAGAPASDVTLLRPVGGSRSAGLPATDRPAVAQVSPQALAGAAEAAKAPDRLVAAGDDAAAAGDDSRLPAMAPAAAPAEGAGERLAEEPTAAAGAAAVAAVPTPLALEELVARSGAQPEDGAEEADAVAQQAEAASEPPDAAAGAATAAVEPTRPASVTSAVNMRAGPNNDAAVLTVVPAGSAIELIACDHWCEVVFAGERGWIYRTFIGGADS